MRCHCGKTSTGLAPARASAPASHGPVMCAVIIYLFMGVRSEALLFEWRWETFTADPVAAGRWS